MLTLKNRITKIIKSLNKGLYEREDVISVALLSALANQNIFLYGPPGTAKSLISIRLSKAFKTEHYFEYLMQKFSTPEEVFGPVSISELKKDNYIRKTNGYLPEAEFAFLDEIWKSSPAILNTLLTLINEKTFKNGSQVQKVPLKVLISASNETPSSAQGLEALYDRFLTRLYVPRIENKKNFEKFLHVNPTSNETDIAEELLIENNEWEKWQEEIIKVKLSYETINIIHDIRIKLEENKINIYISDRRWKKAAILLRAAAFFCDRKETNIVDSLLLSHCLWTTKENREDVIRIVEQSVRDSGFDTKISFIELDEQKEELEKEIQKELFYKSDIYDTVKRNNIDLFKVMINHDNGPIMFYIPYSQMKTTDNFHPIDESGNKMKWIKYQFEKQGTCWIKVNFNGKNDNYYLNESSYWTTLDTPFQPKILFHKGAKKEDINERLIESLQLEVLTLSKKIETTIQTIKTKKEKFEKELETPFIKKEKVSIALESVDKQLESMNLRLKDCERLEALVK